MLDRKGKKGKAGREIRCLNTDGLTALDLEELEQRLEMQRYVFTAGDYACTGECDCVGIKCDVVCEGDCTVVCEPHCSQESICVLKC